MNWFRDLINSGVSNTNNFQAQRGIVISNYTSLVMSSIYLLLYGLRLIFFTDHPTQITTPFFIEGEIVLLSPIIFNRLSFTGLGRFITCVGPIIFIWHIYTNQLLKLEFIPQNNFDSIRFYFLAVCPLPFLIYDRRKSVLLFVTFFVITISIVFFRQILWLLGMTDTQLMMLDQSYDIMQLRTLAAYAIICIACYIFHRIIIRNDMINEEMLSELHEKSNKVISQNNELVESQNKLNEINQRLEDLVEEKTIDIQNQHEKLLTFAHLNAHEVRGPVARLLGLIQLSKLDPEKDYSTLFKKTVQEAKDIDHAIKNVNDKLSQIN